MIQMIKEINQNKKLDNYKNKMNRMKIKKISQNKESNNYRKRIFQYKKINQN